MTFAIQPMSIEHYEAALSLWQVAEGVGLSGSDSPEGVARFLDRNPGTSFVAYAGETLVGAVLSGHDGRRGYIHHLAVQPVYRRQGLGQALVEQCLAALAQAGIDKCHLFVFKQNETALQFWRGSGWTERVELVIMSRYSV
jgi:ribosomal protein S18 acetylase RimI-like enzyme